ncbi:16S rRNA (guanine(966)-N(2))-methyltransferase RsmD, partial [Stenotrophomonas maltophilia]
MDAAAKPPWTGLRRPPQPDPPRQPTECMLLLLVLRLPASWPALPRVRAAARPK